MGVSCKEVNQACFEHDVGNFFRFGAEASGKRTPGDLVDSACLVEGIELLWVFL